MPWQSTQQARWGHSPAGLKALGGAAKVSEWDAATPKGSLKDKQRKKNLASLLGKHLRRKGFGP